MALFCAIEHQKSIDWFFANVPKDTKDERNIKKLVRFEKSTFVSK